MMILTVKMKILECFKNKNRYFKMIINFSQITKIYLKILKNYNEKIQKKKVKKMKEKVIVKAIKTIIIYLNAKIK